MPPPPPPPPSPTAAGNPPNETRAPAFNAIVWIETAICVALIIARFVARIRINGLGADDWTMLFSVILFVASAILISYMASIGAFRHIVYLSEDQANLVTKLTWTALNPVGVFNFGVSKTAVGLLLLRIIPPNDKLRRYAIWFLIGLTMVVTILAMFFIFFRCNPPAALWEPELMLTAKCWSVDAYLGWTLFQGAIYIAVDILFAIIPVHLVWNLQLPKQKKFGLCLILSLGFFAAAMGCIKEPLLESVKHDVDFTWVFFPLESVTFTEIAITIWAGCIPTLRPLIRATPKTVTGGGYYSSGSGGYYISKPTKNLNKSLDSHNDGIMMGTTYTVEHDDRSESQRSIIKSSNSAGFPS